MTTVPVGLHRELSKEQETSKEMSTFWSVVLFSVCGVGIFLLLFGFYFMLLPLL